MYNDTNLRNINDLKNHLQNPSVVAITLSGTSKERSDWIFERLIRFKYAMLKKKERWVVLQYIRCVTWISEKQLDRYVLAYKQWKRLCVSYKRHRFNSIYTLEDEVLLAQIDNATGRLSGGLTITMMQEELERWNLDFKRLASVSLSQLYRLRKTKMYREKSLSIWKTKSNNIPIGVRKKPAPNGVPGYIRVDSVHQWNLDKKKGVYHVNLVDEVTQWEIVFSVSEISERFLLPLLQEALDQFPFMILNFHSDNGSEYINYQVASLLEKMRISQTKSRARRSNDNGLVESKNGAIIRKEFGHWHIPWVFDMRINKFYNEHLIPYLNFHRPCHFPEKTLQENWKVKITYPLQNCMTPYKKLLSITDWEEYLQKWVTKKDLEKVYLSKSPLQAAKEKKKARDELMKIVIPKISSNISVT